MQNYLILCMLTYYVMNSVFVSKFHNYSFNNTLLIALQRPDATLVAGYQAWQKNFNRHVNKGERGIRILAPRKGQEHQRGGS